VSAATSVTPIPDVDERDLRATLLEHAAARRWVCVHFTRDGLACCAVGRISACDVRSVRVNFGRDDCYTVPIGAVTSVEVLEEHEPKRRDPERGTR
jgi:hypothetical protein